MMRARVVLLASVVATSSACARLDAPPAIQKEFEFGSRRVTMMAPGGWDVLDQGRQKRFRNGESEVVLEVIGPVSAAGVRHEVERARDLWKAGRVDESQLRIKNLRTPPELFAAATEASSYNRTRATLALLPDSSPFDRAEPAFEGLLAAIAVMPLRDLASLVDSGLRDVDQDERRREVKSRERRTIDGREAMDIQTWSRLDHTFPQRLLFIYDDGDLLVLHTPRLADEQTASAFEAIRDSFHFVAPAPESGRR
jgi:hypothetical protein